ncbi:MAG: hypothetical protein ACD_28C00409G0009 [uncultured bacterium]|nr:MAG: hypothetical protein ACD_28C00409G0009 [uncultured bacterium]KKT76554.1 MAG: hypothetical protein UW70_C0017G0010 [Candidatus Peregrinibacteria bacterium GW2011_GWA2_44_7]
MRNWIYHYSRLDQLEKQLMDIASEKQGISLKEKSKLKSRVFHHIENLISTETIEFNSLEAQLEKLILDVKPTKAFSFQRHETGWDKLRLRLQRVNLYDIFSIFSPNRRFFATFLLPVILVVILVGSFFPLPQVSASKMTIIDHFSGSVFIEREGVISPVTDVASHRLEEGDRVFTEGDGVVTVSFVDDSQATLGPDSSLRLIQLWSDPSNLFRTSISLELERGRLWSQVVNLFPDSSYTVFSEKDVFSVDHQATFDVFAFDQGKEVRVFDYLVDFNVVQDGVNREGRLGPPLSMLIDEAHATFLVEPIRDFDVLSISDVWVQTNLVNDQNHLQELADYYEQNLAQNAGTLPGELLYFAKRGKEEVRFLFTYDDQSRKDLSFVVLKNRFSEAAELIARGELSHAQESLEDYQSLLFDFAELSSEEAYAVLEENRKLLEGLSAETFHPLREFLDKTFLVLAKDDKTKGLLQLQNASNQLEVALDLIQIGAYDLAQKSFEDYQVEFNAVIEALPHLNPEQREEFVLLILDQKLKDLQVLKLIQAEIQNNEAMKQQLESLETDTLFQLNTLVLNLKDRAVLHLATFLKEAKDDEALQLQILSRLKKNVQPSIEVMDLINTLEAFYWDDRVEVLILKESAYPLPESSPLNTMNYDQDLIQDIPIPGGESL